MGTIPASIDVEILPGVVGAGGAALQAVGLFLDDSGRIPVQPLGSITSFASQPAVANYFGASSGQAANASVYFNGFTGRTAIPSAMLFANYPAWAVSAWLRGGPSYTLAQLQGLD